MLGRPPLRIERCAEAARVSLEQRRQRSAQSLGIDVGETDIESEKAFLCAEIYKRDMSFRTATIAAFTRHSSRIVAA